LLGTGCFPVRESGYRASGKGWPASFHCGSWRSKDLSIHAPDGVRLYIYARQYQQGGGIVLNLDMRVPKDVLVKWRDSRLVYRSPEWPAPREGAIDHIATSDKQVIFPTSSFRGQHGFGPFDNTADVIVALTGPKEGNLLGDTDKPIQEFSVEFPALEVNGERFEPGTVRFEAFRRWSVTSCLQ
jgi:hypothetical protein